jgi:ribosomal protein L11 methyltransferase
MYHTRLHVACDPEFSEILMAEIAEAGFDTFLELENGFDAFCEGDKFNPTSVAEIKAKYGFVSPLFFAFDKIEKKNWNEEWEKNLTPILVDDRCLVRADFHRIEKKYPYEIIITPKMSFGTGHHQTTYLMLKAQLDIDHKDKRVMDAGCGTAILSIMASKRGAHSVDAFDIDEWSVINGKENIENNNCTNVNIRQGKISELTFGGLFDIILANINKNILLDEIGLYAGHLSPNGLVLLSGVYESDLDALKSSASRCSLFEIKRDVKDGWASLLLKR